MAQNDSGAIAPPRFSQTLGSMKNEDQIKICLSAQRALWGNVPQSLRAFSAQVGEGIIRTRAVFDETVTETDKELLSIVVTEIIADYSKPYTIEEEFISIPGGKEMQHLESLIYLRYEP